MNLHDAKLALAAYIAADIPAFLWGAPGIGKSQIAAQLADEMGAGLVNYRLNTLETIDLRGLPHIEAGNVKWSRPDLFQTVCSFPADQLVLVFFDEMNTAGPSMMAAAMQLVLDRRIGPHTLPGNVRIVAAGNRQSDRAAANRMPTALANRFAHINVEADAKAWRAWAAIPGNCDPLVHAFIGFRPNLLHKMDSADARAFPTPRAWIQVSKIAKAPEALLAPLVRGLIGEGAAGEFMAFVSTWSRVPKLADILADPANYPVPDMSQPGLIYATATMLSHAATRANFGPVLTYLERMPQDFVVGAVVDATKRDKTLCDTAAFVDWAARNQDVSL